MPIQMPLKWTLRPTKAYHTTLHPSTRTPTTHKYNKYLYHRNYTAITSHRDVHRSLARGLLSVLAQPWPLRGLSPDIGVCTPALVPRLAVDSLWPASFWASPVSTRITVRRCSCRPFRLRTVSCCGTTGLGPFLNRPAYRLMISFVVNSADEANNDGSARISQISAGTYCQ